MVVLKCTVNTKFIFQVVLVAIAIFIKQVQSKHDSFSFFKFSGPVSGEVEEIYVSDGNNPHIGQRKVDYRVSSLNMFNLQKF